MTDEEDSLPYATVPVPQQFSVCVCVCENKFVCCVSSVIMGWMRVRGYHRTTDACSLCWKDAASVPLIQAFIPGPPMHLEMSESGHGGHGNDNDEESQ